MNSSQIKAELRQRMQTAITTPKNNATGKITFDEEFCGFAGHFPDNPIVPAVCLLAAAELLAMEMMQCNLQLQEITSMKFKKHLVPQDTACLECELAQNKDSEYSFMINITTEKKETVAKIKLRMADQLNAH